ncbi:metallophosphoesterase family protein [Solemya velesiana gill symbiont]|uniref:Metallophosphoesterase n=1 Tax=Solemya velesiana gill symbiont TaxID=1918948 RepID=A0A1T2KS42_9GAMM|nr:metallophosphoesterase [Solemya velesiana gill symbiont]OOZ35684.1 metallophosphoesterase [Solemya velesiana gill symbiont]
MRVAVFSDVQANLPAFEEVAAHIERWSPVLVIMNGDLVNRGPRNLECLNLFNRMQERHHCIALRGNHEDYILHCAQVAPVNKQEAALRQFADWTANQLGEAVNQFDNWADHLDFHAPKSDQWVHVTHGTLSGNRSGISQSIPDEALEGKLPEETRLFITAHTHKVHERVYRGIDILNIGSVGSPFDGDTRSSYAQLEFRNGNWQKQIIRLAYDRDRMARDCEESGFLDQGGPLTHVILEEWRRADLLMPHWNRRYRQAVLDGDITMQQAVDEFLSGVRN